MKWFGITGSWRATSQQVEHDVRDAIRRIILNGDGIVTGGALNVDWFATDEALQLDKKAVQIKVYIPTTLKLYSKHYKKRAGEGVITYEQANMLIKQLTELKKRNPEALTENQNNLVIDKSTYYERNSVVVENSTELYAFQVNESKGTQDTIDKALKQNKVVHIKKYTIT